MFNWINQSPIHVLKKTIKSQHFVEEKSSRKLFSIHFELRKKSLTRWNAPKSCRKTCKNDIIYVSLFRSCVFVLLILIPYRSCVHTSIWLLTALHRIMGSCNIWHHHFGYGKLHIHFQHLKYEKLCRSKRQRKKYILILFFEFWSEYIMDVLENWFQNSS